MCYYHAYTHCCGHTDMIFQQFCAQGQMAQRKCSKDQPGIILTTVKLEYPCKGCPGGTKVSRSHAFTITIC
ncbi:hypothetical protein K491DRAFT_605973 [Lophiostoma macrostomum CBS 122681]|uniref:Uncharacterized protein n=1 Tax=Lophiostoma macrostomum CBS 122681 TaxID=1314788 RepID=A0A6A6SW47_9PLEO|nr:hypothetical protein K491DRAFT_605973 [Lophiostoma macrostomum CBS 122681]